MWHDLMLRPINLWSLNMASRNDITKDLLISKPNSQQFEENFDRIFGVKKKEKYIPPVYSEDWQSEERAKALAQNGNDGLHY